MEDRSIFPTSDHCDGTRFCNPWGVKISKSLAELVRWKMESKPRPWPGAEVVNTGTPQLTAPTIKAAVQVTYIGHATVYLQDHSGNVLTDPQFSSRASPVSFAGPSRSRKPALEIAALPGVQTVLVSHNHYDHMDLPSLRTLDRHFKPTFVVPLGNAKFLHKVGIDHVIELDWWEQWQNIQLVPAQHWSARSLSDRNKALWGGYVISMSGTKIFFAGDTGYGPHFKMIRQRCGAMDLSLLPIGAYDPRWFMKDQHMNPSDATMAHLDLASNFSFAMHFETFRLTDEGFLEPRQDLAHSLTHRQIAANHFIIPEVGHTILVKPDQWSVI